MSVFKSFYWLLFNFKFLNACYQECLQKINLHAWACCISAFLAIFAVLTSSEVFAEEKLSRQEKIEELTKQIDELEKAKTGIEGKALKLENQGQRLQFQEGYLQEAKRALNAAAQFRENAKILQKKINKLKAQREALGGPPVKDGSENVQSSSG